MEPITVICAGIVSVSIVGYVLLKKNNYEQSHNKKDFPKEQSVSFDSVNQPLGNYSFAFTKTDNPPEIKLREIIDNAQISLVLRCILSLIAWILDRVLQATNRGVKVRLITDRHQQKCQWAICTDSVPFESRYSNNKYTPRLHASEGFDSG